MCKVVQLRGGDLQCPGPHCRNLFWNPNQKFSRWMRVSSSRVCAFALFVWVRMGRITALKKPNGGIRGIVVGRGHAQKTGRQDDGETDGSKS